MLIKLHSQATKTPKKIAVIQAGDEPAWNLSACQGATQQTVWKWRKSDSVENRRHAPTCVQATLTQAQDGVAVASQKTPLIWLDDLLAEVRELLSSDVSYSGLDRYHRRHGLGNFRDLQAKVARLKHRGIKACENIYIYIGVKYLLRTAAETTRRYLFVAKDCATRWAFIHILEKKDLANALGFLRDLDRAATGQLKLNKIRDKLSKEHRLTLSKAPQTNVTADRFNSHIGVEFPILHFQSCEEKRRIPPLCQAQQ